MRSIIKLTGALIIFILIPSIVSTLFLDLNKTDDIGMIMAQMCIIAIVVISFYLASKTIRKYEEKTLELIDNQKDIEGLRDLREKRITYKSKAAITKEILIRDPSLFEAEKLRKYTNRTEYMAHYYAALLAEASPEKREEIKIRRDNFKKKYGHKALAYTDFKGNLTTSIKWLGAFFIAFALTELLKALGTNLGFYLAISFIQAGILGAYMINTIIWLSRTTKSYWDKEYI